MKQRTRLVPAFHSHWPCRCSYRWSSSSSSFSFFFSSASYFSFLPTEKERERQGEFFSIGCPFVCPTPSLRHFTSAPCLTGSGSPRNEDIPRIHSAKFPKFATSRPCAANSLISPRIISILSRNSSLEEEETGETSRRVALPVRRTRHPPPSTSYFFILRLSSRSRAALLHTLWSDGTWSPTAFSISPLSRARFISRLLRGHPAVVRTSSAISSIFLFKLPVGNQIATYTKKRNRAALMLRDFCRSEFRQQTILYASECKAITLHYDKSLLTNISSSLI